MGTGRRRPRKPGRGRKERRNQTAQGSKRVGWRNRKGSAAARPKTQYRESASTLQRTNHAQRGQREEKDPNG